MYNDPVYAENNKAMPIDTSRTYYFDEYNRIGPAWQDTVIAASGVLLLVLGVVGIVLEKKLSRYQ